MMELTASYADACNLQFGSPLKEFPEWMTERYNEFETFSKNRLARLRRNCERIGRPYEDIERTTLGTIRIDPDDMTVDDVARLCRRFGKMGFQHVIFNMPNVHEIQPIEIIGREVIPAAVDLT